LEHHFDTIICNWGHAVDGNLHLNIVTIGKFDEDSNLKAVIEPFIYSAVRKRSGSISAEHGMGQSKRKYGQKDVEVATWMGRMKYFFDPRGILNPGKVLPDEYDSLK
jgi:FAD/FMN-containing dehydrogenase